MSSWGLLRWAVMAAAAASLIPMWWSLIGDGDAIGLVPIAGGVGGLALGVRILVSYRADESALLRDPPSRRVLRDYRPIAATLGDLRWAGAVWLVGSVPLVLLAINRTGDATAWLAPLLLALLWLLGACVGAAIGALAVGGIGVIAQGLGGRRWGIVLVGAFLIALLAWGVTTVVGFAAADAEARRDGVESSRNTTLLRVLIGDVSSLEPWQQVTVWASRMLLVLVVVFAVAGVRHVMRREPGPGAP